MGDLAEYYQNLLDWEEVPHVELVAPWRNEDIEGISAAFRLAFEHERFQALPLAVAEGISNQSIGNKVASHFTCHINQHLQGYRINDCIGPGYPDKRLVRAADGQQFAFELKATSEFDPNDSNRIVLTSSSQKLRNSFQPPINHLLATASYELMDRNVRIQTIRLDFLEPTTLVNVRLEASVSQRLLHRATHRSVCI